MTDRKPGKSNKGEPAGVRSVEIGVRLIKVVARANRPLMLSEIAAQTGLQAPSAHRYLTSLIRSGMVERVEGNGRYELGQDAIALGFAALGRVDTRNVALETLMRLNHEIDKSVVLFIWNNDGPVVVGWRESSDPITFSVRLGVMLSPLTSVSGRIFLAYLPEEVASSVLDREFSETRTVKWEGQDVDRTGFEANLAEIRQRGMSRGRSEMLVGIDAIGAPVLDRECNPIYALVAIGAVGGIDVSWRGPTAIAVRAAARELSSRLGHTPSLSEGSVIKLN